MQNVYKRAIAVWMALFLILGLALPALALGNVEMRTVRVGFYHSEGYHLMDEDGNRSGYGYEVLQAMKLYVNWDYEYVGYDKGWADMQQMLLDGEIDLVVSAVKTPAREEIYDFSDRPLAESAASLMVKAGESPYVAGRYDDYNDMRIGFIEGAAQIASTEAFAEEKGFTFRPVYYKTSDELEQAILAGTEVDAIVTSNMRIIAGTRRLEMFAMQDVYAMVQKGNRALLSEINYALEQISLYNPGLYDSLYNKYYSVDAGNEVFFSPDESRFIQECLASGEPLHVALVPEMSPYAYYADGMPTGILYDISSEILRRTGLASELIVAKTDAAYRELIENRGVDLRLAARFDYNYAEKLGYTLTDPYYSTDVSRITRKNGSGDIKTIAVVKDSIIDVHYLPTILEDETVYRFDSVDDCVSAVQNGRCDALYLCTRTAQEAVYADETNRLTSMVMPGYTVSFSIGVRENTDARLASILEKAADSLNDDDIEAFVLKYTNYSARPLSLRSLLYSDPIFIVIAVALLLALLFGGILLAFIARKRKLEQEQNRQLQAALDLAERANSAKSVFMSRMSHEIRTPLNAIIGYNSIATNKLSGAKDEPAYRRAAMQAMDCLTKSDIASKHLLTVINDVLDMSAIESGKLKLANEPFDFKGMVSALTIMFFSQAKARDIGFEVVFDSPTEEWFTGDQMRISQILTNLLSNAVKFTSPGGSVRLSIHQEEQDQSGALIRFEVADTGIGMSLDFLNKIWSPFEQADASISRRFGGTGLGLSITKSLVDLMGGSIAVESEPGHGTTFRVELTLGRTAQPQSNMIYDFSGIQVLVADDDRSTCEYLKLLFNRSRVSCTTVESGSEAIAAIAAGVEQGSRYTLCIIDWHMPDSDALETVRRIRELAGPDMPIIIISAYDFSGDEDAAREAGVDSFVPKPLFQSTIFDLLANISGRRPPVAVSGPNVPDFGGMRVLLAEDNRMNMEIARVILNTWGIAVDEAWNGREAVALFRSAPAGTYGLILMDVHMPEMDGYSATKAIRGCNHADAGTVPIIAMTADVFAEDVAAAMAAGMNDHIGKPIDQELLLETLRKYVAPAAPPPAES